MMRFYNWLVCKLFKRCAIYQDSSTERFKRYCEENPGAVQCRIYED